MWPATNLFLNHIAHKGIGANMLKVGMKRRRTKTQVEAEKEEALLKE